MFVEHRKGERRVQLDLERTGRLVGDPEHPSTLRWEGQEPEKNKVPNRTLHCRYKPEGRATRKKGRNRFKTGKRGR